MGGHVSKKHPGKSSNYRAKQAKRDERVLEREMLQQAKLLFVEQFQLDPKRNRGKVTALKKQLINEHLLSLQPK